MEWGREAVVALLDGWNVDIIAQWKTGFRRTWLVRAMTEPKHTRLAHNLGDAMISEAAPRTNPKPPQVQKWRGAAAGITCAAAIASVAPSASGPANLNATGSAFVLGGPLVTGAGWAAAVSAASVASAPALTNLQVPFVAAPSSRSELEGMSAIIQSLAVTVSELMDKMTAMESRQTQDVLMMDDADLDGAAEERNVCRRTEG